MKMKLKVVVLHSEVILKPLLNS